MYEAEEQVGVATGRNNGREFFQCSECSRKFARVDHLARHVRTHTNERPHRCAHCGKCFARADLLRRHAWRHEDPKTRTAGKSLQQGKARASKACHTCAASKLKCDNNRPCQRCAKRGLSCYDPVDTASGGNPEFISSINSRLSPREAPACKNLSNGTNLSNGDDADMQDPFDATNANNVNGSSDDIDLTTISMQDYGYHGQTSDQAQEENVDGNEDQSNLPYTDFLKDLLFTSPHALQMDSLNAARPDVQTTGFDFWNFGLDGSVDFGNDAVLANVPFQDITTMHTPSTGPRHAPNAPSPASARSPEQLALEAGGRAFSTSVWHWVPTSSDNRAQGQADIGLAGSSSSSTEESLRLSPDILSKRLRPIDRDRVLSVLLAHCENTNIVPIASSFPSYQLMEKLIHAALHFQTLGTISWLHITTFQADSVDDELLTALVAYGAFLSPVSANQKLGTAMADIMRMTIAEQFESNNANTRKLQVLQCYLTVYHLLFWSGSKRRMEIGECFTLPLITMLRRAGAMSRSHYEQITPETNDSAEELGAKWRAWIEQESKLRMVHHLFIHDAQISMAQFINPLLSAAEMTLPLPADDSLWMAKTADEWRLLFTSLPAMAERQASMAGRVRDMLMQTSRPTAHGVQADSASDVLELYGLWHMVWDCQSMRSWLYTDMRRSGQWELFPAGQFTVLSRILDGFETSSTNSLPSVIDGKRAERHTLAAYLRLALYAPIRCLPTFAGRHGEAEAQSVSFMLQEWTQSREGRESLWHAGQVLRHARVLPHSLLQAFFAVAVYHASLVLWSFAIITGARQKKATLSLTSPMALDKLFRLDSSPSPQLNNFVALGEGMPAICSSPTDSEAHNVTLLLYNPAAVMQVGIAILKAQARHRENNLSRFAESLVQLMDGLAKAANSVGFG